jgi:hypothetical protein
MSNSDTDQRFDNLVAQVHEWTEAAVALDEGHFPNEMLREFEDLTEELKTFLEEEESGNYDRSSVTELFITPEMAEIIERFPRVRRMVERAWGARLTDLIEEEAGGFGALDDDEDDE